MKHLASIVCYFSFDNELHSMGTNLVFESQGKINSPALVHLEHLAAEKFFKIFKENKLDNVHILNLYIASISSLGEMSDEEWLPKDFKEKMEKLEKDKQ